jgi:hypothetical protein
MTQGIEDFRCQVVAVAPVRLEEVSRVRVGGGLGCCRFRVGCRSHTIAGVPRETYPRRCGAKEVVPRRWWCRASAAKEVPPEWRTCKRSAARWRLNFWRWN